MHSIPEIFKNITTNMEKVVQGKRDVINMVLLCLFSKGHLLIDDLPGVGKTLISKSLARSIDTNFSRIQFTPDLLPVDIVGVSIWKPSKDKFEFSNGPIFSNLVLADEINRSPPKTQSALLEAMAESQVTVDKTTYPLPDPFMVIATQNPVETYGTYPLLESQLDRFLLVINVGYPSQRDEEKMLNKHQVNNRLEDLTPVIDVDAVQTAIKTTAQVYVDNSIRKYLVKLANATREHPDITIGMSPRSTLNLQRVSQTYAAFKGRDYVIPEDIQFLMKPAIAHRVYSLTNTRQHIEGILDDVVSQVPVPTITKK